MNLNLDALKGVELTPVVKESGIRPKREVIPGDEVSLRIVRNGTAYPSKAFAEKYKLEFLNKAELGGFGLDVFSSKDWQMLKNVDQVYLFACVVPRRLPKVDLWAQTGYNEDGTPKSNVFNHGGGTFAKNTLLDLVTLVFGIDWEKTDYVDLKLEEDIVMKSPNDIYYLPKFVSRGAKRGEVTYTKREKVTICPLQVVHVEELPVSQVAEETFTEKQEDNVDQQQDIKATTEAVVEQEENDLAPTIDGPGVENGLGTAASDDNPFSL